MELWINYDLKPFTGNPPMAMDYEHVEMLYQSIMSAEPELAIEIGSYQGHSTVAFLKAMESLPNMRLHLFEIQPTTELMRVISGRPRVTLHRTPVWGSPLDPDFVFIDGDHGMPALADLAFCLAKRTRTIAMHDTNSFTAGLTPDGSETAANLLKAMPNREWSEDKEARPGKWTHRGFGVSTRIYPA